MRRWTQGLMGAVLLLGGVAGSAVLAGAAPSAAPGDEAKGPPVASPEARHDLMDAMMEAVHGPEAVERVHEIEGVEEMMDVCATMMAGMQDMAGMMEPGMGGMRGQSSQPGSGLR